MKEEPENNLNKDDSIKKKDIKEKDIVKPRNELFKKDENIQNIIEGNKNYWKNKD